jgi:hypothetical protein
MTIILHAVLCGCETWSLILMEEHRPRVKNGIFLMLGRVALVRTDVSEERIAFHHQGDNQ